MATRDNVDLNKRSPDRADPAEKPLLKQAGHAMSTRGVADSQGVAPNPSALAQLERSRVTIAGASTGEPAGLRQEIARQEKQLTKEFPGLEQGAGLSSHLSLAQAAKLAVSYEHLSGMYGKLGDKAGVLKYSERAQKAWQSIATNTADKAVSGEDRLLTELKAVVKEIDPAFAEVNPAVAILERRLGDRLSLSAQRRLPATASAQEVMKLLTQTIADKKMPMEPNENNIANLNKAESHYESAAKIRAAYEKRTGKGDKLEESLTMTGQAIVDFQRARLDPSIDSIGTAADEVAYGAKALLQADPDGKADPRVLPLLDAVEQLCLQKIPIDAAKFVGAAKVAETAVAVKEAQHMDKNVLAEDWLKIGEFYHLAASAARDVGRAIPRGKGNQMAIVGIAINAMQIDESSYEAYDKAVKFAKQASGGGPSLLEHRALSGAAAIDPRNEITRERQVEMADKLGLLEAKKSGLADLGRIHLVEGRLAEGYKALEKAIEIKSKDDALDYQISTSLAPLAEYSGNLNQAVGCYQRLLAFDKQRLDATNDILARQRQQTLCERLQLKLNAVTAELKNDPQATKLYELALDKMKDPNHVKTLDVAKGVDQAKAAKKAQIGEQNYDNLSLWGEHTSLYLHHRRKNDAQGADKYIDKMRSADRMKQDLPEEAHRPDLPGESAYACMLKDITDRLRRSLD